MFVLVVGVYVVLVFNRLSLSQCMVVRIGLHDVVICFVFGCILVFVVGVCFCGK